MTTMTTSVDTDVELSEKAAKAMERYKDEARTFAQRSEEAKRNHLPLPLLPEAPSFMTVVRVPRTSMPAIDGIRWAELTAMARRGEHGLSLYRVTGIERAPVTEAWMKDCPSTGMNKGKACIYSQGWDALTPSVVKR